MDLDGKAEVTVENRPAPYCMNQHTFTRDNTKLTNRVAVCRCPRVEGEGSEGKSEGWFRLWCWQKRDGVFL